MGPRAVRALRGTIAASVSTVVAAASHSIADGQAATLFAVSVALTVSVFVCIGLVGRSLSRVRLSAAVLLSQVAYHGMFAFASPGGSVAQPAGLRGPHAAHLMASVEIQALAPGHVHGPGMWGAHVVAAVVTILALVKGEVVVRGLLETFRVAVVSLLTIPVPVTIGRVASLSTRVLPARLISADLTARPDRGPPVFA